MLPLFKKAKYVNSDFKKRSYDILKIPRKASLNKMRGYPSFKMSFFKSLTLSGVLVTIPVHYKG